MKTGEEVRIQGAWDFFFPNGPGKGHPSSKAKCTIPQATDAKCPLQTHRRGTPLSWLEAAEGFKGPHRPCRLHTCSRTGCVLESAVICNLNISFVPEQFKKKENKLQEWGPLLHCDRVCKTHPLALSTLLSCNAFYLSITPPPTPALSLMRQSPDDFPLLLKSTLSFWRVEGVCCKLLVLNQGLVCPHTQETTWRALEIFWGVTTGAGKCFPHSVVRGQGCRPKADKTRNSSSQQRIILPKVSGEPESGNAAIAGESRNQAWQGGWARRDPPVGKGGYSQPLPPAQCSAVMWDASLFFPTDFRNLEFFKAECVDLKTFGWN